MRVLLTAQQGELNSSVDLRFGRAPYMIIVDTENPDNHEIIPNPFMNNPSGAGIAAAQYVVSKGVQAVISGAFGPNSSMILNSAGIRMIVENSGISVKDAVEKLKNGAYDTQTAATNTQYNYGSAYSAPFSNPFFGGFGFGGGFGWGRGWRWNSPYFNQAGYQYSFQPVNFDEKEVLKNTISQLENQLDFYKKRLNELEKNNEEEK